MLGEKSANRKTNTNIPAANTKYHHKENTNTPHQYSQEKECKNKN
jgi:hypothetical protein